MCSLLGLEKKRMAVFGVAWFASPDIKFESSHAAKIKENLPFPVVVLDQFQGVFNFVFGLFLLLLFVAALGRPG